MAIDIVKLKGAALAAFIEDHEGWPRGTIPKLDEWTEEHPMKVQDNRRSVILAAAERTRAAGAEWPVHVQVVEGGAPTMYRVHANGRIDRIIQFEGVKEGDSSK